MQKKKLKNIPKFKNEDEERAFWATHDTSEYFDWEKTKVMRSHTETINYLKSIGVKVETKSISIRLPLRLLLTIKKEAKRIDVPYQSYIKMILSEKFEKKH